MKYAIIIADGAADFPIPELGGETPFEAARTPNLDRLARTGRVGRAVTTPPGFGAGSDVCSMSLLGYDPRTYHTGRAPLEAAAMGLRPGASDWIFRLNFVTVGEAGTPDEGLMLDHSAGAITDAEARRLVADLSAYWREKEPALASAFALTPGVSYRNILVDSSERGYADVTTVPPHEIPREPWAEHLPAGQAGQHGDEAAAVLTRLIELSGEHLPSHPVNAVRRAAGKRPANLAWIWGQGVSPSMPSFESRFGLRGAMITAVDLLAGIAALIGWDRLHVPGVTSYHDTDYLAQGRATCDALGMPGRGGHGGEAGYDIVCCHVESPDEASHQGDCKTKVAGIESIDEFVVGPVLEHLTRFGDPQKDPGAEGWRVLVMPDHYTLVGTRKHDATPVPFVMGGAWVRSAVPRPYSEVAAAGSDLCVDPGDELMEYFLRGGLAQVSTRVGQTH